MVETITREKGTRTERTGASTPPQIRIQNLQDQHSSGQVRRKRNTHMEGFWILLLVLMVGYECLDSFPILILLPFLGVFFLAGSEWF
jgi:hypothetical protein